MNKHTPGPWEVVAVDWSEEGNARFEIHGITRTGIADARLIAAAPELLDALRTIVETDFLPGAWNDQYEAIAKKARAAIAQATGEPS